MSFHSGAAQWPLRLALLLLPCLLHLPASLPASVPSSGLQEAEAVLLQAISSTATSGSFSALELGSSLTGSVAEAVAKRYPESTIVSLLPPESLQGLADDGPSNCYKLSSPPSRQAEQVKLLHDSPTLFTFTVALGVTPETFTASLGAELAGISRHVFLSRGAQPLQQAQESLAGAAAAGSVQLALVEELSGGLLKLTVGRFSRAVRHHFSDNRRCPIRGYWFTYQSPSPGAGGEPTAPAQEEHPRLQRLKYGLSKSSLKKGGSLIQAFGCTYTNQRKGPLLTQQSWVNLFTLSGLGFANSASEATKRQLIASALLLPHFEDGVPWNACVEGSKLMWCDMDFHGGGKTLGEAALSAECKGGHDWKEEKSPPCILDMMLMAIQGCDSVGFTELRDAWFGGSGNSGKHPKACPASRDEMRRCRRLHGWTSASL